jgi:hypothetical protein
MMKSGNSFDFPAMQGRFEDKREEYEEPNSHRMEYRREITPEYQQSSISAINSFQGNIGSNNRFEMNPSRENTDRERIPRMEFEMREESPRPMTPQGGVLPIEAHLRAREAGLGGERFEGKMGVPQNQFPIFRNRSGDASGQRKGEPGMGLEGPIRADGLASGSHKSQIGSRGRMDEGSQMDLGIDPLQLQQIVQGVFLKHEENITAGDGRFSNNQEMRPYAGEHITPGTQDQMRADWRPVGMGIQLVEPGGKVAVQVNGRGIDFL